MSVINDVLKDLETRESRFTPIEIDSVEAAPRARRDRTPLLLAVMLLPLLAMAAWFYLPQQSQQTIVAPLTQATPDNPSIQPPAEAAVPPQDSIAAPDLADSNPARQPAVARDDKPLAVAVLADNDTPAGPTPANQIVGLQIRESEQEMRMEFVMREKVVAYLRERGQNSFEYHLRDIESRIAAPVISNNPWIQALDIETGDDGVGIRFETMADILVETRQNFVDGEPVWAISLRKAIAPQPPAVVTSEADGVAEASPLPVEVEAAAVQLAGKDSVEAPQTTQAEVRLEIKTTNPDAKIANQLDYATRLIGSGRYADAEKLLRQLLGGVEDYQARRHLLAFYHKRQKRESFDRLASQSVAKYPQDVTFRTEYARALFQGADYRAVIALFDGRSSLDANQQALLAASYQRLDEHDSAIRHYRLALRQDDANAKNWIGLAISQEHSARLEAALDSYQRAVKIGRLNERLQAFVDQRSDTLRRVLN